MDIDHLLSFFLALGPLVHFSFFQLRPVCSRARAVLDLTFRGAPNWTPPASNLT